MARKDFTTMGRERYRTWAGIIYEESAPENLARVIESLHMPIILSPLHCDDVKDDGTKKKPHWHFIAFADNPQSMKAMMGLLEPLHVGGGKLEHVISTPSYTRYLCHMDNPEKAQYSPDDVRCFGGAVADFDKPASKSQERELMRDITRFVLDNGICEYADLLEVILNSEQYEWADWVSTHTIHFNNLCRSNRFRQPASQAEEPKE